MSSYLSFICQYFFSIQIKCYLSLISRADVFKSRKRIFLLHIVHLHINFLLLYVYWLIIKLVYAAPQKSFIYNLFSSVLFPLNVNGKNRPESEFLIICEAIKYYGRLKIIINQFVGNCGAFCGLR